MEFVSFAVGVAGLAGLFSACVDAIENVHAYKNYDYESSYINAPFAANKPLFQRWADGVGISSGKLKDVHHPDLDNVEVVSVVGRMLSNIQDIFSRTDSISSKLAIKSTDDEILSLSKINNSSQKKFFSTKNSHASPSRGNKLFWALGGKTHFIAQVDVFGVLVGKLYEIIPVGEAGNLSKSTSLYRSILRARTYAKQVIQQKLQSCSPNPAVAFMICQIS